MSSDPNGEWREWETTHSYWRDRMREFATASLRVLRNSPYFHGKDGPDA